MSRISNARPQRLIERALCAISEIAWRVPLGTARRGQQASSWVPGKRSDRPSRSAIPLGVPRTTRSVCPDCVIETRNAVLDGRTDINVFKRDPGVINAEIIEEAGRILMRKICQIHGPFEDVLATDAAFFRRMERLYPGPDFACTEDDLVHDQIVFGAGDRKSTRLNSSHTVISYAVFCLKKKKKGIKTTNS